jgi:hypothetical protein
MVIGSYYLTNPPLKVKDLETARPDSSGRRLRARRPRRS